MAKPTQQELRQIILDLAGSSGGKIDAVTSSAVNRKLLEQGLDPMEARDVSLAKSEIKQEAAARSKAPFKDAYAKPVKEFSFQYWFNYFYVELPNDSRKQHYFDQIINPDRSYKPVDGLDKRKLLRDMMLEGFQEFTIGEKLDPEVLFQESIKSKFEMASQGVRVVFRGDGRTPKMIEQHKGTIPQSRLPHMRQKTGMDQDWHPFKDNGNKVYYRKGFNADNCLFTAISVTPEFEIATKFPLLSDLMATDPGAIGTATVEVARSVLTGGVRGMAQGFAAQGGASNVVSIKASRTNTYVVKLTGGWNTMARQLQGGGTFAEYALEHLPWIYHIACFRTVRLHYGDDPNLGHQIVFEGWDWLQPKPLRQQLLMGPANEARLEQYLESLGRRGSPQGGGIVYVPEGMSRPAQQITKVLNPFIPGHQRLDAPAFLKSNASPGPAPGPKPAVGKLGAGRYQAFQK